MGFHLTLKFPTSKNLLGGGMGGVGVWCNDRSFEGQGDACIGMNHG